MNNAARFIFLLCFAIMFCLAGSRAFSYESPNVGDLQIFPPDNPWHRDISNLPVHPNSENYINSVGRSSPLHPDFGTVWNGAPNGIPFVVVSGSQPKIPIVFTAYGNESDPGPYPIPADAPIEGGHLSSGDRHVIVIDKDNRLLYELYSAYPKPDRWEAQSGAIFKLDSNQLRPGGWTSADAAGLPIFAGLVRYEEVAVKKKIDHAIRVTVRKTQRKFLYPATHFASFADDPNLPPMGLRFRLKASYDISGFPVSAQVILKALKKYGMIVADNGGPWFISGAPDSRWNDEELAALKRVKGNDFEVVLTGDK